MAHKIIIDTDPGVDDAIAILLALNHPDVDLLGLTTVFGNIATTKSTQNAIDLLSRFEHPHIPVAHGADKPLEKILKGYAEFVHGDNGLGNIEIPHSDTTAVNQSAAEFIVEQVLKYPGEVTICAIAPLTNLALALELEPKIAKLTKQVVIMGGAFRVNGNVTPVAEANIYNDPLAADKVINAGWPVSMIGLDVTHKVILDDDFMQSIGNAGRNGQLLYEVSRFYGNFYKSAYDITGIVCHDATALIYITNPEYFTTAAGNMRVPTEGICEGMTVLDTKMRYGMENPWTDKPVINACLDVNPDNVKNLLKKYLY